MYKLPAAGPSFLFHLVIVLAILVALPLMNLFGFFKKLKEREEGQVHLMA